MQNYDLTMYANDRNNNLSYGLTGPDTMKPPMQQQNPAMFIQQQPTGFYQPYMASQHPNSGYNIQPQMQASYMSQMPQQIPFTQPYVTNSPMYYQQPIQQQPQMQQQPMYSIQDQMNQSQQQIFSVNNSTNDQQKSQTNSPYKNEKNQQATRQSQRMKNIRDSKKSDVILFFS
jgi:hypothetical protein